jgi:hypothetical protein
MALQNALTASVQNGGGAVRLNAIRLPSPSLTARLTLPNNRTIDGSGLITLPGPVVGYIIVVEPERAGVLKNLTITNFALATPGVGVLNEGAHRHEQ